MELLWKWPIRAELPDAYMLSGYKLLTSGSVSQVGAHLITAYIQVKYKTFISTLVGLKSKFVTNTITVKAYVAFHKLKPTAFCPTPYSVFKMGYE